VSRCGYTKTARITDSESPSFGGRVTFDPEQRGGGADKTDRAEEIGEKKKEPQG